MAHKTPVACGALERRHRPYIGTARLGSGLGRRVGKSRIAVSGRGGGLAPWAESPGAAETPLHSS